MGVILLSLRKKPGVYIYLFCEFRWCIGAILGLLFSSEVSGGHINPAVTVALATLGKFPWRKVPHYLAAQYLGAFVASACVFLVYWEALVWYEHDRGGYRVTPDTAAIFGTYPSHHLTFQGGILDQVVGTALLLLCVCAITDKNNMKVYSEFTLRQSLNVCNST